MKVIGITGAVGSGKSTVAKELSKRYHMKLIMADELGHLAYKKDSAVYPDLCRLVGSFCMEENGEINRKKVAQWAYGKSEHLQKLNALIHPFVKEQIRQRIHDAEPEYDCVLLESAILIENGYEDVCDEFWYVYVTEDNRRKRLKESRGLTEEQIQGILSNQKDDAFFRKYCRCIIDNNASIEEAVASIPKDHLPSLLDEQK